MSRRDARGRRAAAGALLAGVLLATVSACAAGALERRAKPGTAPAPEVFWTPPPGEIAPAAPAKIPEALAALLEPGRDWGLADLVDVALRVSPHTRGAWSEARAAAAAMAGEAGTRWPTINLQAAGTAIQGAAVGGLFQFRSETYGPELVLDYLLLDGGGREARIEQARQALIAADWAHNGAIQEVILRVQQAYYEYMQAQALLQAERAAVEEARTNLDAAERRHEAGVATIADVLQARTALAEARLSEATVEGRLQVTRGLVATAIGAPATASFDIALPEEEPDTARIVEDVGALVERAIAMRPDLAGARADALRAEARIRAQRSLARPSLATHLEGGRTWFVDGEAVNVYTASLLFRIPLFSGQRQQFLAMQAEREADAARARAESLEQQVVLEVWTSYYELQTAAKRLETVSELVASARQSRDVAAGRYEAGVGSILDLLAAQSGLENARAQQARARTDWFVSLARLARDTGTLGLPAAAGRAAAQDADIGTKGAR